MRVILNILVFLTLVAVLVGVVAIQSTNRIKEDQITSAREEVRRFQRQITLQAAVAEVELNARGFPTTIDPSWFNGKLPANPLLEVGHPWVEIAGRDARLLMHPVDLAVDDLSEAQFWYNPYKGILRARVPADISDAKAVKLYNRVNSADLTDLFSRVDPSQ